MTDKNYKNIFKTFHLIGQGKGKKENKIAAFTLAEVLITLGIIGVVAAMTLPTLINDYKVKTTVTKLKKFYSVLSQSYLYAVEEYGTPSLWDITTRDTENAILVRDRLFKNTKILTTCNNEKMQTACGLAETYYFINGNVENSLSTSTNVSASLQMSDGSSVIILTNMPGSTTKLYFNRGSGALSEVYALVVIDLNGSKEPNTLGKDVFVFYMTNQNITPDGSVNETTYSFEEYCYDTGRGCAAWVVYNENMDYLKCSDLSWDSKHSCKE